METEADRDRRGGEENRGVSLRLRRYGTASHVPSKTTSIFIARPQVAIHPVERCLQYAFGVEGMYKLCSMPREKHSNLQL